MLYHYSVNFFDRYLSHKNGRVRNLNDATVVTVSGGPRWTLMWVLFGSYLTGRRVTDLLMKRPFYYLHGRILCRAAVSNPFTATNSRFITRYGSPLGTEQVNISGLTTCILEQRYVFIFYLITDDCVIYVQ